MNPAPATTMNGMTRVDAHGQCCYVAHRAVARMRTAAVIPVNNMRGRRNRCVDMSILIRLARNSHSAREVMSRRAAEKSVRR